LDTGNHSRYPRYCEMAVQVQLSQLRLFCRVLGDFLEWDTGNHPRYRRYCEMAVQVQLTHLRLFCRVLGDFRELDTGNHRLYSGEGVWVEWKADSLSQ